jgi:hypothetical protein
MVDVSASVNFNFLTNTSVVPRSHSVPEVSSLFRLLLLLHVSLCISTHNTKFKWRIHLTPGRQAYCSLFIKHRRNALHFTTLLYFNGPPTYVSVYAKSSSGVSKLHIFTSTGISVLIVMQYLSVQLSFTYTISLKSELFEKRIRTEIPLDVNITSFENPLMMVFT